jgi:hypothetical protein
MFPGELRRVPPGNLVPWGDMPHSEAMVMTEYGSVKERRRSRT